MKGTYGGLQVDGSPTSTAHHLPSLPDVKEKQKYGKNLIATLSNTQLTFTFEHVGFFSVCKPLPSRRLQSWSCLFQTRIMTEKLERPITMSNHNYRNQWCRMIISSLSPPVKTRHLLTSHYLYCCSQLPIRQVPLHWSYYMIWEHLFFLIGRETKTWK